MFEKSLTEKLRRIFQLDKVTFDKPGDSQEQEGVFIAVDTARCRIKDAKQTARVNGTLHIYANSDKLPYGYFAKKIAEARPDDVANLLFYDFEENVGTFVNIVERKVGFLFLFDSQYDPAIGTLTSINLSYPET